VARPKVPLISRRKALAAALEIIDEEGLDSLSIRRLADELGVNGASLYHHFKNKEEIVVGAAELALADVRTPTTTDEDWHTWLPRNSRSLRRAMLDHPELIPIIIRKGELGMGVHMMETSALRLVDEGVPLGAVVPLLDALETFAIGSAIHEARGDDDTSPALATSSPLAKAAKARLLSADEIYQVVSTAIVEAVEAAAGAKDQPRRRTARAAGAAKPAAPKDQPNRRTTRAAGATKTSGSKAKASPSKAAVAKSERTTLGAAARPSRLKAVPAKA
jgi:TetR/AcrR family tetracycline transcriptional repressor